MDMNKKSVKIVWSVIMAFLVLWVCISIFIESRPENLSGRWEPIEGYSCQLEYLEFFKNGTYVSGHSNYEGKYSVDGDRLMLQGILVDSRVYTYEINGNELTLYRSDGDVYCIFEKIND